MLNSSNTLPPPRSERELRSDLERCQQMRDLIHKLSGSTNSRLPDETLMSDAYEYYLHPHCVVHLFQDGDEYQCDRAIVVWHDENIERFEFDPPIKTACRIREMSYISVYQSETHDENIALTAMFHKDGTEHQWVSFSPTALVPSYHQHSENE